MVSFQCEGCGDVLTKKKLDQHRNQCYGCSFSCLDCMVHFNGTEYRAHTSCISEAQKYQGHLYREKDGKKANRGAKRKSSMPGGFPDNNSQAMVSHKHAYVEDAPEGDEMNAVAVIDVPPKAPTPPPANEALPPNVNVFDYLVQDVTPGGERKELEDSNGAKMIKRSRHHANGDSQYSQHTDRDRTQYLQRGYSYGTAPVQPTYERYDSWQNMTESQQMSAPLVTPGPKSERKEKKSEKKRKRADDLDLSSAKRPSSRGDDMTTHVHSSGGRTLHTGLTGGLSKLVTDPDFYEDRIDAGPTPISPIKRHKHEKSRDARDDRRKSSYTSYSTTSIKPPSSKENNRSRSKDRDSHGSKRHHKHRRGSSSSPEDRRQSTSRKVLDYSTRAGSVQPSATNQLTTYKSPADLFLSFVKGPESERGCSVNKALKRYHRELSARGEDEEEKDKELWKSLRLRKNDRGEIVLFVA
ncbi:cell growth-regulating nucleolar protein-like [Teratosphaeria destructans]|uniref:Cell growth-regulating nucleolar protein-like n=1 Tax=Teratosphaeria destructans TaxID=418781 RepID=A0A9W7SZF8_9PEZI|nr:cell growth-regulating nucleolar protein-like [Teratosphaeria destructans]